ncbi:leucine--tRNA ligase [Mycoplasma mycoides subsp. mycoides]|uniref:Leucine--tRNA ligase n=2 Tax=Mycoplasma mycoides subsp. mycoides TaxID=2103 RepID=SYL_MYCMS|nr:leucine--tRNA ligase [Mycoplasma mycoides]Q6MSR0.2 RecName: Full=Leucine--tRNA ligase; AltName: Full=Leucyl-tRNA synthetase; Short=LeuRS [Mycoplasma mycoides subsp. mycoides SC str. PG1]ADK69157.1 leucine--tRNA ligase [Mycoplasma mycoides subsp. mycoides SC str. Gladysdale]AIZ55569.1 Leucine--tRNA ligase [Mycoplasma mycoides subsp. mycoides]AMK56399.1 Leucine--tRNA ligase [Mycoplasma mycoides subsp. mycoides]KJQ45707.1 leucine--tRNA ligase [Mycoplasma mycoides subsp. mycoides]KJQ47029.1 le
MDFSHKAIEKKWQKYWKENNIYKTTNNSEKKAYILDMFPYPSGAGLHVGHIKGYTATDVYSRFKRMQGYDVLHPIGWDAFGLPAEQYALKTGNDPREFTLQNIENFKIQLNKMGFSYDYDKEINTADPNYYKTTQWIFKQLYKKGLAENRDIDVNWCQELGTVLANDEIIEKDGLMVSERGEYPVVKKKMRQWVLKITDYADKLLDGLDNLDWPNSVKELQRNWIGKSEGCEINFKSNDINIPVFTTRADTIFGVTYIVLASENELVLKLTAPEKLEEVKKYIELTANKSEIERKDESRTKTGVFIGSYATNPLTKEQIQIWISDYVLNDYGSGAIMAVPAHDKRDWDFAAKFNLPIKFVIQTKDQSKAFVGEGIHINSEFLNDLDRIQALQVIHDYVDKNNLGKRKINYKLRDWLFSRQRFYGEPFPVLYDKDNNIVLIEDNNLPITLPITDYIKPTNTGESPLANVKNWVNVKIGDKEYKRETNTMPQSAASSWYFIAYILANSKNNLIDLTSDEAKKRLEKWLPVDLYIGGQEHAVGHLLYARFWTHFLYDLGLLPTNEPFKRLFNQGMILGPDNRKMSKSWGNVINPDDVIDTHGADALRLYEMFMGPLDASLPWSFDGLDASLKWLNRCYRMINKIEFSNTNNHKLDYVYNDVVKKVTQMIQELKFNTAISQLMVLVNAIYKEELNTVYKPYIEGFVKMLSLFAPHLSEELWEKLGNNSSVTLQTWPEFDETKIIKNAVVIALQVNGKLRSTIEVEKGTDKETLIKLAQENENIIRFIKDHKNLKYIAVVDRIVNIVIE